MNYLKILSVTAIAAASLLTLAGAASATIVTSNGSPYTSTITAESSFNALHGSFITIECSHSHIQGKVASHGAGVTAEGNVSGWSFSGCNYPITILKMGTFIIHGNNTITHHGAHLETHSSIGTCTFQTNNTEIGSLTEGNSAKLHIDSVLPRTGGSFFCGSTGEWTGNYTVSTPGNLTID